MEVGLVNNTPEMEAGLMKNIAAFLMRAGFYNKLILYTLRQIVREELSAPNCPRRIVLRRIVLAELSAPNCPAPNCPDTTSCHLSTALSLQTENTCRSYSSYPTLLTLSTPDIIHHNHLNVRLLESLYMYLNPS